MQHWMTSVILLFLVFCDVSTQRKKKTVQTLSRGWGDDITWVQTYEEGLSKAVERYLKADDNLSNVAGQLWEMLPSTDNQHETTDTNLAPDGFYVPRILFVDPSLTVRADIVGKYANRMYTYEPNDMDFLAENMIKAKILLKVEHEDHDDL